MTSEVESRLSNPFWHALNTEHAALAIGSGVALRYPPEVVPFAGLEDNGPEAMAALRALVTPGEIIYVTGAEPAACAGLEKIGEVRVFK
jgi:hypothetical protein